MAALPSLKSAQARVTPRRRAWASAALAVGVLLTGVGLTTSPAAAGPSNRERDLVLTFSADADLSTMQGLAALDVDILHTYTEVFQGVAVRTDVPAKELRKVPGVASVVLDQQVQVDPPIGDPATTTTTDPTTSTTTTSTTASTTSTTAPTSTSTTTPDTTSTTTPETTTSTTTPETTTTVPAPTAPWGLDRTDQRTLPLSGTFKAASTGKGVTAYIVDTGVFAGHSEFTSRIGNGFSAFGGDSGDCDGHGTHVAGTVGGTSYGMAKEVFITPVRVLDCDGRGSYSSIAAGLDWIVKDHQQGTPAVANLSLGPGPEDSSPAILEAAVRALVSDGVSVVVAAGNEARDACGNALGSQIPGVVVVGSTNRDDSRRPLSNTGACVDLFAPGGEILSAGISSPTATQLDSGTSMAAPHVAGAAAILLSLDPWRQPTDVESALVADATTGVVVDARSGSPNLLLYENPGRTATAAPTPANVLQLAATKAPLASPAVVTPSLAYTGVDTWIEVLIAALLLIAGCSVLLGSQQMQLAAAARQSRRAALVEAQRSKSLPIELIRANGQRNQPR